MKTQAQTDLVAKIAEQTNTPLHDVEDAYKVASETLRKGALFQDFIPLLAAKRVTEQFKRPRE